MWQAPNGRMRAIAAMKKRERERLRPLLHIRRIETEITIDSKNGNKTNVRIFLNDFTTKGIGLFCPKPLEVGETISMSLAQADQPPVKGKVVWCAEHDPNSHIMSKNAYSYRAGVEFLTANAEEENKIKEYCDGLTKTFLMSKKAA